MEFLTNIGRVKVQLDGSDLVLPDEDGIRYVMDPSRNVYRVHSFDGTSKSRLEVSLISPKSSYYILQELLTEGMTYQEYSLSKLS